MAFDCFLLGRAKKGIDYLKDAAIQITKLRERRELPKDIADHVLFLISVQDNDLGIPIDAAQAPELAWACMHLGLVPSVVEKFGDPL